MPELFPFPAVYKLHIFVIRDQFILRVRIRIRSKPFHQGTSACMKTLNVVLVILAFAVVAT